ncbi:MAG: DUF4174 domain-containing protein [Pseudomonadota bacterium]
MKRYAWHSRPLLVFAPSPGDARLKRQQQLLAGRAAALRERDMVVIFIVGDAVSARFGRTPGLSATALRRRFGVAKSAFRTILVGKDTGVKRRSSEPLSLNALAAQIDRMPMRRQEIQRKRKTN